MDMEHENEHTTGVNFQALFPVLAACMGSTFLGSSAIFVRLSDLGPITTGFYRILFALPLLAIWMVWEKEQKISLNLIPKKDLRGLFAAGLFFALDLALWNWSIDFTTIVNSTLFNNTAAFFVPLIMWLLYRQKQSALFFLAVLICFIGCICLLADSISINLKSVWGDIVALLSGIMVALYLIVLKRIRENITTGYLMFWTGLFSLLCLGVFAIMLGESFWPLTVKDAISIFGQAIIVHVLGQSLLAFSLGKVPTNYVALILFLAPATAGVLGWIVYAESLSLMKITGILLIVVSIITVKRRA